VCLHLDRVLSPLPLHARHSTGDTTHTTNGSTGNRHKSDAAEPAPRPGRREATRDILTSRLPPRAGARSTSSFNGLSTAHACRITRREMRDVCRCALPLVHTSLARRGASGPPNPLVAARLHGSAPHARSASTHVDPCQHVKYPLVPVRFALTRHAACMLNAADQVGYPTSPRPSRRIGVPHIHTFPTFTPLPPLPLSEDTKARRPSRPPPTASPGRPPSLPHCQRP
jgi:hypothetical protein